MIMNIDTLTDKIYQEGIEKAENEAAEIIDNAKSEAKKIFDEAKKKSENIIDEAKGKAKEIHQNTLTDIRLAGNKAILSLKLEIKNLLKQDVLDKNLSKSFSDPEFIKEVILEVIKNQSLDIEKVILPENLKNKINKAFKVSLKKSITDLHIDFNKKIEGGFQIAEKDTGYIITFTDKDFAAFFSPFLNETSEEILFKSGK